MNLDELQSVQSRERQTDSLQQLRNTFYEDAATFVKDLRDERNRVASEVENPFDEPRVTQLNDDIRTAEGTIQAIYERRVGKVVKMASLAAADMPTEEGSLTQEEAALFETLVDAIEDHRDGLLEVLDGDRAGDTLAVAGDRPVDEAVAATSPDADEGVDAADVMGGDSADTSDGSDESDAGSGNADAGDADAEDADAEDAGSRDTASGGFEGPAEASNDVSVSGDANDFDQDGEPSKGADAGDETGGDDASEPSAVQTDDERQASERAEASDADEQPPAADDTERTTVRITDDVGAILGVDEREYDLSTDDVVTLPAANAEPLIERDAAERLE